MTTPTASRSSLAWTVRTALTDQVRAALTEWLDAEFTDGTTAPTGLRFAHDARVFANADVDGAPRFRLVLHWAEGVADLPPTDPAWATGHVQEVIRLITGAPAGPPEQLTAGSS